MVPKDMLTMQACVESDSACGTIGRPLTLVESVHAQKANAEKELARLTELEELLKAHPETQRILELIGMRF
jgi:hypothetical protein